MGTLSLTSHSQTTCHDQKNQKPADRMAYMLFLSSRKNFTSKAPKDFLISESLLSNELSKMANVPIPDICSCA